MPSVYPGSLDSLATNKVDSTPMPTDHPTHHNDLADAVNKIEAELGIDPAGAYPTLVERLDDLNINFPPMTVRNQTGAQIDRGTAVSIIGVAGSTPRIEPTNVAVGGANFPAIGILLDDLPNNTTAAVVRQIGTVEDFDTSAFSAGDRLFVSAVTPGLLTNTEPAHPNLKQRVAIVINSHASQGSVLVLLGSVRGDHEGTNRNTWVVGDQGTGIKSITFRRASADHLLRTPDSANARTWDLPDISGKIITNQGIVNNYLDFDSINPDPAAPASGDGRLYAKDIVNGQKVSPKFKGPLGIDYVLQPSLYQQQISAFGAGAGTTVGIFGTTVTSVGTVSHQAPTSTLPVAANFITAGSGNATSGTGHNGTPLLIGSGGIVGGFFFYARFYAPDASYPDYRIFVGTTSTTMALTVSEVPGSWTGHRAGLYVASDHPSLPGRWYFRTRDGTTTSETVVPNTRSFVAQEVYDFYMFVAKQGDTFYWRLTNLTQGWTEVGSSNTNIPGATNQMRGGIQLSNVTGTTARNIRLQRCYTESDV